MLGVKRRTRQHQMASSDISTRKRRLRSSEALEVSPTPASRKRAKSSNTEEEGLSPTFSAKCFYNSGGRGGYQTPLERQKQRELYGVTLPFKPSPPSDNNLKKPKKLPTYGSVKVSHARRGARPSWKTEKTAKKLKTEPVKSIQKAETDKDKSQSESLDMSAELSEASPQSNTPKTSPKKRSPKKSPRKSPRTPRKSPRKGVKKAVKLYLQGMKKDTKAAGKRTAAKGRQKMAAKATIKKKATQDEGSRLQEPEVKQRKAPKKLDLDLEGCASDGIDTDLSDDIAVIAPSPKPTKKRSMRLKEDSAESMSCDPDRRSPRKSQKTLLMAEDEITTDQHDFLDGFQPQSPDEVTTQIPQKVSPRKVTKTTASLMNLPISPSSSKTSSITPTSSPSMSNKVKSVANSPLTSTPVQQRKLNIMRKMADNDPMEQMTLDLGQRRFGATSCEICGMVYTAAHPEDEASHDKFHRKYLNSIKFPGWKNERLLQEFDDGRVIMVLHDDPKYHTKKVEEIRQLVDQELGFLQSGHVACKTTSKVLLFITSDKKVAGCLIAEEISKGYRVIADAATSQSSNEEQSEFEQQRAWCCETNPEPAVCGISRIWVASQERRKQIATKLLDCLRNYFMFGIVLPKESLAFSDPTPDGKMLATAYMKTARFLVYKYH